MSAEKILIVEDNPLNMRLMRMTLRGKGYTLIEASNGEEALDKAVKEKPDLIIMDMQLPTISGIEATQRLRKIPKLSRIPVIAVTAYAMKGDQEKFIEAGFGGFYQDLSSINNKFIIDFTKRKHERLSGD
jgi:two-component system cell cycle response regulator DivK